MEGIDRIKHHILEEAMAEIETIEAEARAFVSREIASAEKESRTILGEAEERAEEDTHLLVKRAEGVAEGLRRKLDLERKQALAHKVIQGAVTLLREKSPAERVALYASWIHARGLKEGTITLSATDLREISDELLKALLPGRFEIADEAGNFTGGLIVTHGRVRDNLTYDMMVRDYRPELAREALEHLGFGNEEEGPDG